MKLIHGRIVTPASVVNIILGNNTIGGASRAHAAAQWLVGNGLPTLRINGFGFPLFLPLFRHRVAEAGQGILTNMSEHVVRVYEEA